MTHAHGPGCPYPHDICTCEVEDDYLSPVRILPDGRQLTVEPLTFGRARLSVGPVNSMVYDDQW